MVSTVYSGQFCIQVRIMRALTCRNTYSTSVLYRLIQSPPCSKTNALSSPTFGTAFNAAHTRNRLSRNNVNGIAHVFGPISRVGSGARGDAIFSLLAALVRMCVFMEKCFGISRFRLIIYLNTKSSLAAGAGAGAVMKLMKYLIHKQC